MKEWKAPEKEAQKMTRDGAVSVNLVTGETTYPSDRTPEQDHSASGDTAGAAGKVCKGCIHPCKQSFRAVVLSCPHYLSLRSKKCGN